MTLLARSQAGVQLPQGRPVSLRGEPSKRRGRGQGKWERKLLSQYRTGRERGQEHRSQKPEVEWESRGFVSSVSSEPMLNGIPCPAVSHLAVLSASRGYANSGR